MLRIALFLATNMAVLLLASVTLQVLGLESFLQRQGLVVNLSGMLIFAAVLGFGGAFVSLFLSKMMAKLTTETMNMTSLKINLIVWMHPKMKILWKNISN